MTAAVESFVHAGYDLDAAAILLCESDGSAAAVEEEIGRMADVLRALRRDADRGERERGAAAALLERAQERVPGERPHQPRLHVHGLDDPEEAPRRHADRDRRDGDQARAALRQRLPRRRRQPAPADPVRRQRRRSSCIAPRRSAPRSSSSASRWAAPSPASTASASRSCRRCASSSRPPSARRWKALKRAFDPAGQLNPGKVIPTLVALRRVRPHARQARPARVSRAAALLRAGSRMDAAVAAIVERVRDAHAPGEPLRIRGGGTKDFYGEAPDRRPCST